MLDTEISYIGNDKEFSRALEKSARYLGVKYRKYPANQNPYAIVCESHLLIIDGDTEQARQEGKPDKIIEKMVEGRMRKEFYARLCLNDQPFVKGQSDKDTVGKVTGADFKEDRRAYMEKYAERKG